MTHLCRVTQFPGGGRAKPQRSRCGDNLRSPRQPFCSSVCASAVIFAPACRIYRRAVRGTTSGVIMPRLSPAAIALPLSLPPSLGASVTRQTRHIIFSQVALSSEKAITLFEEKTRGGNKLVQRGQLGTHNKAIYDASCKFRVFPHRGHITQTS